MNEENVVLTLWEECKKIFLSSSNENLMELLINVLEIVKKNYNIFQQNADSEFLDFMLKVDAHGYIIGTNGDDFERRLKTYAQQKDISIDCIWRILSQLTWDLMVPVTETICPFCHCDNLSLLVDGKKNHIYESCENCFWISENKVQIMRPECLFPADKNTIKKYNYMPYIHKNMP